MTLEDRLSPGFQQIGWDTETGDYGEQGLEHSEGAKSFIVDLRLPGPTEYECGMEARGHARWFERRLAELKLRGLVRGKPPNRQEAQRKQKRIGRMLA